MEGSKTERQAERQTKIRSILEELTLEERKLLSGILEAEREKLHMEKPRYIYDDLWNVVKEIIR